MGTDTTDGIEREIAADTNAALQFKQALIQAKADARRRAHEEVLTRLQSTRNQTVNLAQAGMRRDGTGRFALRGRLPTG